MRKKRVMIVDDDTNLVNELKNLFTINNLEVETLSDAAYVVRIAEVKQPDVILLDMKMPGKSGFQVADDLKQFSATAKIPIIAMTGHYTQPQHKNFMISLGISDCIIKPFDPQDVILKIHQFMLSNDGKCDTFQDGAILAEDSKSAL